MNKTWENLCDVRLGKELLGRTPKSQSVREKVDKLNLIKIKIPFKWQHLRKWKDKLLRENAYKSWDTTSNPLEWL